MFVKAMMNVIVLLAYRLLPHIEHDAVLSQRLLPNKEAVSFYYTQPELNSDSEFVPDSTTMAAQFLTDWISSQKLKGPSMKDASIFYRNLEEAIDVKRRDHVRLTLRTNIWRGGNEAIDFISNDLLSLGVSGQLRTEMMKELDEHQDLAPGSGSTRLVDGNYEYIEMVEQEIANFHGAEAGIILGSGFNANVAIFTALPRPGDVIVFDELVHASSHDGMAQSEAIDRCSFRHNDAGSLEEVLSAVCDSHPLIKQGKRCVLIAVESVYSFDGDVCPLTELLEVAKEACPLGNVQFVVDEAHATGVIGPKGAGLVCELGLEKDIAVRLHTFGKALASSGAIILGNSTVKAALINFARCILFSTSLGPFPVAAIRSAYKSMMNGKTKTAQRSLQRLVKHFFSLIAENMTWQHAMRNGVIDVPLLRGWEQRPFVTPIVPIFTRPQYATWMVFHLTFSQISAVPVDVPTVRKGQSRVRLTFHAHNTEAHVEKLVTTIAEWAQEMMDLESRTSTGQGIPKAARQVYAWMGDKKAEPVEVC
ncbi:MAG: putative secondary metabolism biosynthetic enzyme [Bathelium mastoideum]|nr:MAG: putative secondary metabolism biosynthetic enzyme [Bathelium mastoideum]KAI9692406.1 MAG: putative secondary metabolism biosynthetic enzyme [Bathelium mastoideum]